MLGTEDRYEKNSIMSYTMYIIEISYKNNSSRIFTRHSHLEKLETYVRSIYPELVVKILILTSLDPNYSKRD